MRRRRAKIPTWNPAAGVRDGWEVRRKDLEGEVDLGEEIGGVVGKEGEQGGQRRLALLGGDPAHQIHCCLHLQTITLSSSFVSVWNRRWRRPKKGGLVVYVFWFVEKRRKRPFERSEFPSRDFFFFFLYILFNFIGSLKSCILFIYLFFHQ